MGETPDRILPSAPDSPMVRPPDRRGIGIILWQVIIAAETIPLDPPKPPADLAKMPLLQRLHACVRLFLLDIEYALSPGGQLRGICKLACRISVVSAVLLLCLAGLLACILLVVGIVVVITRQLVEILWNLLTAALLVIALLVLAGVLAMAARLLIRRDTDHSPHNGTTGRKL